MPTAGRARGFDGEATERAEAEALLLLQRAPGLGDRSVRVLVERFGSGRSALEASDRAVAETLGEGHVGVVGIAAAAPRVPIALDAADALGMRVLPMGGAAYPERLLQLADPPPVLFLRGRAELLAAPAAAVVGSRRATAYGRRTFARIAGVLACHGVCVVSGLALGVDAEAHRAALEAPGPTLAVHGAGADVPHPPSHARLFGRITGEGCW